jgi:hypothetical protein
LELVRQLALHASRLRLNELARMRRMHRCERAGEVMLGRMPAELDGFVVLCCLLECSLPLELIHRLHMTVVMRANSREK